jgi:hypothetical protein
VLWLMRSNHKSITAKTHIRHDLPRVMSSEADEESIDLFQEPDDFYEPEKQATFASHQLISGQELTVRLVGHNPLWVSLSPVPLKRLLSYDFPSAFLFRCCFFCHFVLESH